MSQLKLISGHVLSRLFTKSKSLCLSAQRLTLGPLRGRLVGKTRKIQDPPLKIKRVLRTKQRKAQKTQDLSGSSNDFNSKTAYVASIIPSRRKKRSCVLILAGHFLREDSYLQKTSR